MGEIGVEDSDGGDDDDDNEVDMEWRYDRNV